MAQNLNLLTFLGQKFKDLFHELSHQAVSKYFWKDLLIVLMGVLLYTVGFSFLIYPQRVTTGGLMGICNIITIITGIKVDIPYNIQPACRRLPLPGQELLHQDPHRDRSPCCTRTHRYAYRYP